MSTLSRAAAAALIFVPAFGLSTATTWAADAVVVQEPVPAGFNWSGFYIGVGGGFGAVVHELSSDLLPGASLNGLGGEGAFGELTIGYDHMLSDRFLIGAFADGRFGNIGPELDVTFGGVPVVSADVENSHGFDVALRAGYLVTPQTLAYVLGGYTWQKFQFDINVPGLAADWDQDGYVVGIGMETVLAGNWTLKTEYRYADYGRQALFPATAFGGPAGLNLAYVDPSTHTFHIAANYRFGAQNGGGAGFVSAAHDFTGFFIGAAAGAGAMVDDTEVNLFGTTIDLDGIGGEGVFGEISAGYDHEFDGRFVAGILVDGRFSGISTDLELGPLLGPGSAGVDADHSFDVLGRVGVKVSEASLAYALAGYSWQHFDVDVSGLGSIYDWGSSGFSVGGGLEAGLTENVALNLEYRFSQYEDEDFSSVLGAPAGTLTTEPSFHTVRVGAKYKFRP